MKLKTFNITFRPNQDKPNETETVTYEAESMDSAHGMFINDYPDQAEQFRETHSPLSNYEVDRENAETTDTEKITDTEVAEPKGIFDDLFTKITDWVKLFTVMLISLIGLGVVSSALFGIDSGFGIVTNISKLLSSTDGLVGLIVLFLVYYLFIRSDEKEKT